MYKAIKDNKIIAISDTDSEFLCLVKDSVESDPEHTTADYDQYNGEYLLKSEIPIEVTNEKIRQIRANLYAEQVDILHAQKTKETIMGEWSDEKEQKYIAKVKELTIKIREENPYIE